jgi:glycosyltransferase involved in cell wall biosynthesis
MYRLLYIVSTLKRAGPTNQLLNLIENLDQDKYESHLITLSSEPEDSRRGEFEAAGVKLSTLGQSRIQGLFGARKVLTRLIDRVRPDLIHTQGIRADSLISRIEPSAPWLMTARNYPYDDYPMKFGALRGGAMAIQHVRAMKRCKNIVACSKTIASFLGGHKVEARVILNGIRKSPEKTEGENSLANIELRYPVIISVGSLIERKNMKFIIEAFGHLSDGSLIIVGAGPEAESLKVLAGNKNVYFTGEVSNVHHFLKKADYFVTSSLSEGLPNTVLEALAAGLPVFLSDIPSHSELQSESLGGCHTFSLSEGPEKLARCFKKAGEIFSCESRVDALRMAENVFSAKKMSSQYQSLYKKLVTNR